jgi:hypothetical protein
MTRYNLILGKEPYANQILYHSYSQFENKISQKITMSHLYSLPVSFCLGMAKRTSVVQSIDRGLIQETAENTELVKEIGREREKSGDVCTGEYT